MSVCWDLTESHFWQTHFSFKTPTLMFTLFLIVISVLHFVRMVPSTASTNNVPCLIYQSNKKSKTEAHERLKPQATAEVDVSSSQLYHPFSILSSALPFFTVRFVIIFHEQSQKVNCVSMTVEILHEILSNLLYILLLSFWINSLCILNWLNRNDGLAPALMYVDWLCFSW